MAKIKFGMMMTDARGKLGGQVFTKSREGATVRTKVTPVNRRSPAQMAVRSALGALSRAWSYDPAVDREAWASAAESVTRNNIFGDSYSLTGKSYFQSANQNRAIVGLAQINIPGALTEMPTLEISDFEIGYNNFNATLAVTLTGGVPEDVIIVVAATRQNSLGRNNFSGQYRILTFQSGLSGSNGISGIDNYEAIFGEVQENKRVSLEVWLIHKATGLASPKQVVTANTIDNND